MIVYFLIFILAVFLYIRSNEDNEQSKLVLGIYLAGLALFVGCADMLGGYDRYIYGEVFDATALLSQSGNYEFGFFSIDTRFFPTEWGFMWFNRIMGYITLNRYVFIFTATCIIYTLLFVSIKRYCRNYPFAVIVFLGLWFFFTFTYLRQVMAATIGWLAIKYVIDRKPIQFFLIVFIAFTFHNSAIVLAPFYFVPFKKFQPIFVVLALVAALAIGMGNVLSDLVAESDAFVDAARAEQNAIIIEEGTFRIEYFIEAILFAGLLIWKYDAFDDVGGKLSFVLALIGVMNFINLTVTSINERRTELGTLRAIGMTGRQMTQMLRMEGVFRICLTFAFVLTAGMLLNHILVNLIAGQMMMFSYKFVIWPVLACIPIFTAISIVVPGMAVREPIDMSYSN